MYNLFGSKAGLIDAVIARGFEVYREQEARLGATGDPLQDLRTGWDFHVDFGLSNPSFYILMASRVKDVNAVGTQRASSDELSPEKLLRGHIRAAEEQGLLTVDPRVAIELMTATVIGVTLRQALEKRPAPEVSRLARESVMQAITREQATATQAAAIDAFASENTDVLGDAETALFRSWLHRLKASAPQPGQGTAEPTQHVRPSGL